MQGGTGQNGPRGGQQAIKMCFGTILDHSEATGPHLEAKKKSKKKIFGIFWTFFDMSEICQVVAGPPAAQYSARSAASRGKKSTKIKKKIAQKK